MSAAARHMLIRDRDGERLPSLEAYYRARTIGDVERIEQVYRIDARFHMIGNPALNPPAGIYVGRANVMHWLRRRRHENSFAPPVIHTVVSGSGIIAVRWSVHATYLKTGIGMDHDVLDILRVDAGGFIAEHTQYSDTLRVSQMRGRMPMPTRS